MALGDFKALLMHIAGKHTTEEILQGVNLMTLSNNSLDEIGFNPFHNVVWRELRRQFPEKMDPSKLEGETLKADECPAKFLQAFQRKWREETGSAWNPNSTIKSLFNVKKVKVKKAMPPELQK